MFEQSLYNIEAEIKDNINKTPFSLISQSQITQSRVIINLRSNKKLISNIVAYDKHFNLILKNCVELGVSKGKKKGLKKKDGFEYKKILGNVYLRGDSIITISLIEKL